MLRGAAVVFSAWFGATAALADVVHDCTQKSDADLQIKACTSLIEAGGSNAAVFYYNRANAYDSKGDYDAAIPDYTKAIELNPKFTEAYNERGFAYFKKKQYDNSVADATMAIEIDPRNAGAYLERSYDELAKLDYDDSIADATKAIEINPKFAAAYSERAFAYEKKGDTHHAIQDYRHDLAINPSDRVAKDALQRLGATF
jgi:tetratricopeptide (TPR) repeat protein